jgi:DNA-directed RNA polymerase specialized sigma subunit
MNACLEKDCVNESFGDVKLLIYNTVQQFKRKYNIYDVEELIGIGHLAFMEASHTYKNNEGTTFSSWVRFVVWKSLLNHIAREAKVKKFRIDERRSSYRTSHFIDFFDALGTDAKQIVNLILQTPSELQNLIEDAGGEMKNVKRILRAYLKETGWKEKQIRFAFAQIQGAL